MQICSSWPNPRRLVVGLTLLAGAATAAAVQPGGLMAVPFDHPDGRRWGYADAEGRLRGRGDLKSAPERVPAGSAAAVALGDDSGVIDDHGRWLIPPQPGGAGLRSDCRDAVPYTVAMGAFTGTSAVRLQSVKDQIVDRTGRPIPWPLPKNHGFTGLSQGTQDCWILAYGSKAQGWHYVSTRGRRMLYGGFDSLGYFSCFGEPRRCLASASPKDQTEGLHGLIDEEGRWVVTPRWPSIDFFGDNGLARAGSDAHWVFIDAEGRTVLEPAPGQRFDSRFVHGRAVASVAGLAGFIDRTGRWTAPPRFAYLGTLSADGLAVAREPDSTAMGYVDAEGRWHIPPAERLAHPFSSLGLAAVRDAAGCTTLIDTQGGTVNAVGGQDQRWQPESCRVSRLRAGLGRLAIGEPVGATALLTGTILLALGLAAWAARPDGTRPVWRRTLRAWAAALLPAVGVALAIGVYRFVTSGQLAAWEGLTLPQRNLPTGVVLGLVSLVLATGLGLAASLFTTAVAVCWRRPPSPAKRR